MFVAFSHGTKNITGRVHTTPGPFLEATRHLASPTRAFKVLGDTKCDPMMLQSISVYCAASCDHVISTVRYGHIAPKTHSGKVVTIFYAILGIPLMLLCLSNIGDVMASSFRFLYWRLCCYVCTRPPKERVRRSRRNARSSFRRRVATRGPLLPVERSHSDTDCRYRDSGYASTRQSRALAAPRARTQPPRYVRPQYDYGTTWEREREREGDLSGPDFGHDRRPRKESDGFPKISLPLRDLRAALLELDNYQRSVCEAEPRSKSVPRGARGGRGRARERGFEMHDLRDVDYENYRERRALEEDGARPARAESELRSVAGDRGRYDRERSEYRERDDEEYPSERRRGGRARSAFFEYDRRRARSPSRCEDEERGRRRLRRSRTVDDSCPHRYYSPSPDRDEWSDGAPTVGPLRSSAWGSRQSDLYATYTKEEIKPVPIWLCVFLVASYIVAGTFLFKRWEGWAYLDAAYFCFITLTTIGFGDFVPAQGQGHGALEDAAPVDAVHSIALCSLYLLFGIALLAMSFNLVQEEVRANVAALATRLGIIKPREVDP
ncbi:unnamed protein product [Leptosia nina]|uniref:Potassium channel domain-containing protein n=1 Tax=Leptosia nina TaxID=320188 RepID=A0AAV1K3P3_9NEOP